MEAPMSDQAPQNTTGEGDDKSKTSQNSSGKVENILKDDSSKKGSQSWNERRRHVSCMERKDFACKHNPYVKFMMTAMERVGCPVDPDLHIVCEPCASDSPVNGGFDPTNGQIVLCENKSPSQRILSTLLTHELIHAYDHCRAKVDWTDIRHVACSEIRASSLSGDCSFLSDSLYGWKFRFRKQHQSCVRSRAVSSILAVRSVSRQEAEKAVDDVWETCFKDHAPFTKIPRSVADLGESLHDQQQSQQSHDQQSSQQSQQSQR